jgi:hypothetical protein
MKTLGITFNPIPRIERVKYSEWLEGASLQAVRPGEAAGFFFLKLEVLADES